MINRRISLLLITIISLTLLIGVIAAVPLAGPKVQIVYGPTSITEDTYSSNFIWGLNKEVDFFYIIDQTDANSMSIKLYVSPRAVNWYRHNDVPTIVAENTTDASGYVDTTYIQGFQYRLLFDVTDANAITVTVVAVLRN